MVFDISSQMKLAQSITELTMKNMSAAVESATASNAPAQTTAMDNNPFAQMMDPANWAQMMQPGTGTTTPQSMPSMWWPMNPAFLNKAQPQNMAISDLGLPNMAIPLGLNPFGKSETSTFSLPVLSAQSPLAGGNKSEWPNMFWWLVQNGDNKEPTPSNERAGTAAPWAMIMDPFGLIDEPQPEPEEIEQADATPNFFEMMLDPFGLMKTDTKKTGAPKKRAVKTRTAPTAPPPTPEIFPNAADYFDPFGLMKTQTGNVTPSSGDDSRNMFFGFQPNAKHPLMNDGSPTGMFYLAIALPKNISNINPHLLPWNLAV